MSTNDLANNSAGDRAVACLVLAGEHDEALATCLASIREHTSANVPVEQVAPNTRALNAAIARRAPADVAILSAPCRVPSGWLERLAAGAHADTNTASASALTLSGGPLALPEDAATSAQLDLPEAAPRALRPRITRAVGPCTYWRRDALQLAGPLDEQLDSAAAVEVDLAQRCLLAGMSHVAADDVVVEPLTPRPLEQPSLAGQLSERYPYLEGAPLAESSVLTHALRTAAPAPERLPVTLDARALDGAITGTHVHILELILALARTEALELRLLVRAERIDEPTRALLGALPATKLLAAETLAPDTPVNAVFHRPQQTFSPGDVGLALALGERFVISQLDLIAYRNPGYFTDVETWKDYRAASRHGLSAAERIVVFSQHTRDELIADALVDAQRVRIVPPGLDHRPPGEPRRPAGLDPASIGASGAGFLLCLGTDFRHKNRIFALRLLCALRERHGWDGELVLAGTHISTGSSAELERDYLLEHPELGRAVISLGPVDEAGKAWLLANAAALVYPSVYEGFGLVPFESALGGVPCVFAAYASLAEAAPEGTAAIVPWDAEASAAAAHRLLTDSDAREHQVEALAERARTLRWDDTARAMVEIYREAALAPVRDAATLSRDVVEREARLSVQHVAEVSRLVGEREHAKQMYDELNLEVGDGLGLIGPHGALPDGLQRALLALTQRPALSRPLFALLSSLFLALRAPGRLLRGRSRRGGRPDNRP